MPARATKPRNPARPSAKRSQSAFEFLLLVTGGVLFVILTVAVVRTSLNTNANNANNTAGGYQNFVSDKSESSLYQAVVSDACIVGYSFSEGSDTTTADASGNGYTGTLTNGPTWTTGVNGNAIQFDGTNDLVDTSQDAAFDFVNTTFTVSAWVNMTQTGKHILGHYTAFNDLGWFVSVIAGGNLWVQVGGDASSTGPYQFGTTVADSTWRHLVVVFQQNGTDVVMTAYNNGVSLGTSTTFPVGNIATASNLYIASRDGGGNPFNGTIDEVAVYNRALTAAEVTALYHAKTTWCS